MARVTKLRNSAKSRKSSRIKHRILRPLFLAPAMILLACAIGAGIVIAGPSPIKPNNNPEAGLSDTQRETLHQQQWTNFEQRYQAWVNNLDVTKIDLRTLPRYDLNAVSLPGRSSLKAAVAAADVIVAGTVARIVPTAFDGTNVDLTVDVALKGAVAPSTLTFVQPGGLRPTQDWSGVVIAESESSAFLLPGDKTILFLEAPKKSPQSGRMEIQSVSGWYMVTGGVVKANRLNTWGKAVEGETQAAFLAQIQSALIN